MRLGGVNGMLARIRGKLVFRFVLTVVSWLAKWNITCVDACEDEEPLLTMATERGPQADRYLATTGNGL